MRTTWLERISVGLSSGILVAGVWAGFAHDALWLNRCGSLIIVIGVAVAAFKLNDILRQQIERLREKHEPEQLKQLEDAWEKFWGGPLDPSFKAKLLEGVRSKTEEVFGAYIKRRVERVRNVEISLLILGTLVNGFGDWLIGLINPLFA
ncbi:hypothetical protein [Pseudomonas sp. MWU13-3659]|uniref:hypothetical protein n=1 Tax=Pseudomonas sp. MWU13-3659 TaxID=2986964 RepID=UPI0020759912|nr:hypothetical protein [Pseudomonas sp. MWU13-3659]